MDGEGRLARSLRSLRPQADLRAAALGAVIVAREWLSSHRKPVPSAKRRDAMREREEQPHRFILLIENYLPRRAGVTATLLLLFGSAAFGVVKGGHVGEVAAAFDNTRNALANSAGFRITAVSISGNKQLTRDEVLAIGGVSGRSSLLFLDADTVRDKLKAKALR